MHYFDQQSRAKKQTVLLFGCYLLIMVIMIYCSYSLVQALLMLWTEKVPKPDDPLLYLLLSPLDFRWEPNYWLFATISVTVLVVLTITALVTIRNLKGGGTKIAMLLDGHRVVPKFAGKYERRFHNIVEEMAVASGIRVPEVFVMKYEKGINAFTAGWNPNDAVICISQGMLDQLSRDELQGVVAHEFSHILHGDTRFNLQMTGLLAGSFALACLSWVALGMMLGAILTPVAAVAGLGADPFTTLFIFAVITENFGVTGLYMIAGGVTGLAMISLVNVLFASFVRFSISRQREYLADASAVQWTRFPAALVGALQKIDKARFGSRIFHSKVSLIRHMTFASTRRNDHSFFSRLLDTHPPVGKRIRAIESRKEFWPQKPEQNFDEKNKVKVQKEMPDLPLKFVTNLIESIPLKIRQMSQDATKVAMLVYALFLDTRPEIREKQFTLILKYADQATVDGVMEIAKMTDPLLEKLRPPLAELTFPTLRGLSIEQYQVFRKIINALISADGQIDLFEYTFLALLVRDLDRTFRQTKEERIMYHSCKAVFDPFIVVLSRLAYAGNTGDGNMLKSYNEGIHVFGFRKPILSRMDCDFQKFDDALRKLAVASPPVKKRILRAFTACIMADNIVTDRERELLRAISAMLGAPMPILVSETL